MDDLNHTLTDAERALLQIYFLEKGVIPFELPSVDIDCKGGGLTLEERRVANRKFRKLWRKILKMNLENVPERSKQSYIDRRTPGHGKQPTEVHKNARKAMVLKEAMKFVKDTVGRYTMK